MSKLKIFIAGHKGMVGSALVRYLEKQEVKIITKERSELDFLKQNDVQNYFTTEKIDQVYLAAAKVGGIHANNTFPGEFIYENLMIQSNIIHSAFLGGIKKLLFLGSSCIYPKNANQPMKGCQSIGRVVFYSIPRHESIHLAPRADVLYYLRGKEVCHVKRLHNSCP